MSENVAVLVVVVIVAIALIAIVAVRAQQKRREERRRNLSALATAHEWRFIAEDRSYAKRWEGPPFTGGGSTHHIMQGHHRGRRITMFEYVYTTSTYNGTTTVTQSHVFSVWTIELPVPVPDLSVGPEGAFGGKVAEAFSFARVDTGDGHFDDVFKVKCDDPDFARAVLTPDVVAWLKRSEPWPWRLTGNTILAYEQTALTPETTLGPLERLSDLLDLVPDDAWRGAAGRR